MTDVLVFGHAGYTGDDDELGGKFTVPNGVTIYFYVDHGSANTSNPLAVMDSGKRESVREAAGDGRRFSPGAECHNYVYIKGIGKHWNTKKKFLGVIKYKKTLTNEVRGPSGTLMNDPEPFSYGLIHQSLQKKWDAIVKRDFYVHAFTQNWAPHYVTIRNRKKRGMKRYVHLEDIVGQVKEYAAGNGLTVRDFYCAGCRGIHEGWRP